MLYKRSGHMHDGSRTYVCGAVLTLDTCRGYCRPDEAFEGLTAEQHREAMEHIKAEFDRLKAVQHREILDRIDRRIRAIQQGKDPEFKEAAEKIEREYEEEVGLLGRPPGT